MSVNYRALIGLLSGSLLSDARTEPSTSADEDFLRAAVVVRVFDRFEAVCRSKGVITPAQAAKVVPWLTNENVKTIRVRLADTALPASYRRQVDLAANQIVEQINAKGVEPCAAAAAVTQTNEASFAKPTKVTPSAAPRPDGGRTPTQPSETAAAPEVKRDPVAEAERIEAMLAQIDRFAFATRPKMGVGGMIMLDIYPVVLLHSGEMLTDVEGLMFSGGLEAHKRAHPKDWTRWRRAGGSLEQQTEKGWERMEFQKTYQSLPEDFRLDGLYRHLGGAGTVGIGGTQSVTVYEQYRFFADGRLLRGGGAGASSSTAPGSADTGGGSVVTNSVAPDQRGSYRIDRMLLSVRYDDGSTELRVLITDPDDPRSVIWIDGTGYVRRKQ